RASSWSSRPRRTSGPPRHRTSSMGKSRIILPIEGMSCASCAATVQEALTSATGVASATVNYATAKAAVDYDDAETGVAELIKTEDPVERERGARRREVRDLTWRFALAAAVAVVAMLGSMLLMAEQPDTTFKQVDLLGRLLMPLALRLHDTLAGRFAPDPQ